MRARLILSAVLIVSFAQSLPAEEEFYYQLPEDGVWSRYYVNLNIAGVETASPWIVASVGQKTVDGEKCRWIELKQMSDDSKQTLRVFKFLVPEKAFGKGKDPVIELRATWVKQGDEAAKEVNEEAELEIFNRFVMLLLRGPTENLKTLEQLETIDWQNGKLKCSVITGESSFESEESGLQAKLRHRILINDKIPFRMAGSKFQADVKIFGQDVCAEADFSIVETGMEAKSVLPNVN